MPSLAERLRGIVRPVPSSHDHDTADSDSPHPTAAEVLGGERCDETGHPFLVVDRTYSPGYRHGRVAIADAAPPTEGWGCLNFLMRASPDSREGSAGSDRIDPQRCLF